MLAPGGLLAIADWTATGAGLSCPPLEDRYDADTATAQLPAGGFEVVEATDRRETFVLEAHL